MAKRNPTADQAARFIEIRDKLQADKGLSADNPRLGFLATATLFAEQLSARVIAGDSTVSMADLQAVQALIVETTPAEPIEVKLTIARKVTGICPHCKAEIWADDLKPLPPRVEVPDAPAQKSRTTDDGKPAAQPSAELPANVVPLHQSG